MLGWAGAGFLGQQPPEAQPRPGGWVGTRPGEGRPAVEEVPGAQLGGGAWEPRGSAQGRGPVHEITAVRRPLLTQLPSRRAPGGGAWARGQREPCLLPELAGRGVSCPCHAGCPGNHVPPPAGSVASGKGPAPSLSFPTCEISLKQGLWAVGAVLAEGPPGRVPRSSAHSAWGPLGWWQPSSGPCHPPGQPLCPPSWPWCRILPAPWVKGTLPC